MILILYLFIPFGDFFMGGNRMNVIDRTNLMSIIQTENIIVAILLGNSEIIKKYNGLHEVQFKLPTNRSHILEQYLENNTYANVDITPINEIEHRYRLNTSFTLEKIIRDWTNEQGKITVFDPTKLTANVFTLWLCLFTIQDTFSVTIKSTSCTKEVAQALCRLYEGLIESSYICYKDSKFHIGALNSVLVYSLRNNRPSYETLSIASLMTVDYPLNELRQSIEGEIELAYCE